MPLLLRLGFCSKDIVSGDVVFSKLCREKPLICEGEDDQDARGRQGDATVMRGLCSLQSVKSTE